MTPKQLAGVRAALEKARTAMDGEDNGALRNAVDELSSLTYKMTETLTDESLVKLADDETIKTATDKVTAYVQTTCGAGIYETTTTSSG